MPRYDPAEIDEAFRNYWNAGMVREDWEAWVELFTEDVIYYERVFGTMRGRDAVRQWILPLMERYGEIYGVYDWHTVHPTGRVVFRMLNRRDHPSGNGTLDFPGVTVLQYAGDGKWSMEEDYWAEKLGLERFQEYESALREHDPEHRSQRTRLHWGDGPPWSKGRPSYWDWPGRRRPA